MKNLLFFLQTVRHVKIIFLQTQNLHLTICLEIEDPLALTLAEVLLFFIGGSLEGEEEDFLFLGFGFGFSISKSSSESNKLSTSS